MHVNALRAPLLAVKLGGTAGFPRPLWTGLFYLEVSMVDYSKTLNLPVTDFPMRANLPAREPEFLDYWQTEKIYEKNLYSSYSRSNRLYI